MIKNNLKTIEIQIKKIKNTLKKIGDMRPGSLTEQFKDPKKKIGAYYQLSYTLNMKSKTEYIKKAYVKKIRRQIVNYKKFRQLNEELVMLGIERSRMDMKSDKNS